MSSRPTVWVVDDNVGVCQSLRALLESAGYTAETYLTAEDFLRAFDPERPGCLLLDVRLRNGNGLDIQDELRRREVILPIIVVTGHGNVPITVRALKAGAFDFLQKPVPPKLLLERVQAAVESDRQVRNAIDQRGIVLHRIDDLTPREHEIMELLIDGQTSKKVASALQVSVRTVEGHRRMILSKMHVTSAAQLVRAVLNARGTDA